MLTVLYSWGLNFRSFFEKVYPSQKSIVGTTTITHPKIGYIKHLVLILYYRSF